MASIFQHVSTKHNVPLGDFPNPQRFASIIKNWEIWKFPQLKPEQIACIDEMLEKGVPRLLAKIEYKEDSINGAKLNWNPFNSNEGDDEDGMAGIGVRWVITQQQKQIYDEKFFKLETNEGKASGGQVKQVMLQTGLNNQILGKVWGLCDLDKDGLMNSEEFALCLFMLEQAKNGKPLPDQLPENYIPPSFRKKQKKEKNPFDSTSNNTNGNKSPQTQTTDNTNTTNTNTTNTNSEKNSSVGLPPPLYSKFEVQDDKKENSTDLDAKDSQISKTEEDNTNTQVSEFDNNKFTADKNENNEYQFNDYGAW